MSTCRQVVYIWGLRDQHQPCVGDLACRVGDLGCCVGDSLKLREGLLRRSWVSGRYAGRQALRERHRACERNKRNRRDCRNRATVGDKGESMRGFERDVCMCDDDPSET